MIGVAAKLCQMHPQTLRLYERMGLVNPARVGTKNRVYSRADIERLLQIQHLTQDMGVNLAGVEVVLDLLDKMNRMRSELESELDRLRRIAVDQARRIDDITG
jgi:MerR family transcriptional regulator, heat shock protein HspR